MNSHVNVLISFGRLMVTSEVVNTVLAELEVFQSTIQSNMYSYCVHVHGHTCTLFARHLHTLVVAHELGKHIVFQLHKSLQLGVVVITHVYAKGQRCGGQRRHRDKIHLALVQIR